MFKASNSRLWAFVVALYFLEYGVWQFATGEVGAGIVFTVMALVWFGLARLRNRRTRAGTTKEKPDEWQSKD